MEGIFYAYSGFLLKSTFALFFLRTPKKAVDSGEHEFKVKIGEFAHLGFSYLLTPNSEIALRIAAKLN